jgi:hypothetical protein
MYIVAGRLADGWKGTDSPSKAVTTSIVLEDVLLLIRGHGMLALSKKGEIKG